MADGKDEYTLGICVTGEFEDLEAADKAATDHGEELVERFGYTNLEAGATPSEGGRTMAELDQGDEDDGA